MPQNKATILDRITESNYSSLLRYVRHYTFSMDEAMDVVQETFRIALENEQQLLKPSSLISWLKTIARNEAMNRKNYYKKLILVSTEDMDHLLLQKFPTYHTLEDPRFEFVAKELNASAPVYGAILRKYYWEGYTFEEISKQLHLSAGTVRSYHMRILRRIKKKVMQI